MTRNLGLGTPHLSRMRKYYCLVFAMISIYFEAERVVGVRWRNGILPVVQRFVHFHAIQPAVQFCDGEMKRLRTRALTFCDGHLAMAALDVQLVKFESLRF